MNFQPMQSLGRMADGAFGGQSQPLQQIAGAGQQLMGAITEGKTSPKDLMGPLTQMLEGLNGLSEEGGLDSPQMKDLGKMLMPLLEMLQKMLEGKDAGGEGKEAGGASEAGKPGEAKPEGEQGLKELLGQVIEMLKNILGGQENQGQDNPFGQDQFGGEAGMSPFGGQHHCANCFNHALKNGGGMMSGGQV